MPDLRARSNVEIVDAAFQLYSRNFALYFALGLIGSLASLFNMLGPIKLALFMSEHLAIFITGAIIAVILGLIAYCAYTVLTSALYHDQQIDLGEALSKAMRRLLPLFFAYLISSIAIGIGFVLLVIPGLILLVRLSLVLPVSILEENLSGTEPLSRSFALTKGHALKVIGMGCILFAILIIASLLEKVFPSLLPNVIGIVIGYLVAAVINPIVMVIGTIFYFDLRIRNEGYDIQALATDMAPNPA
jgi:hypothetical protein